MPASEATVRPARRWMRRLIRCALWTAILGFVLLAGLLWLLQQPMCKNWIQQRLSEQTEGEITFESVGLSWNCALKLNGVQYKIDSSGGTYTLSSQSLQLDDLLFGRPHLYLRNIGTQLGGEQVLSASRGVVAWPEPESGSPFALTFHQADIDFFPILRSLDEGPKAEPASAVVSPTMRIEVLNSKVRLPWKTSDILWNASIDLREGAHRASGLLHLSPVEGEAQNRLSLSLDVEPQQQIIHAAHLHAEQFPFTLYDPVLVDGKFDGDMRIDPLESGGYQSSGNFIAAKTVYKSSGVVSVVVDSASSAFDAIISPTYALESIQATIHHSPVAIDLATSGLLPLPTGDAVFSVTRANSTDPFTKFDWRSNAIGTMAVTSRAWPPSSTGQYAIGFSVPSKSIGAIRGFLPKWADETVPDVSGMLALSGNIELASQTLAQMNMRAVLKDGRYEIAGVELNSLQLAGPIQMDAAKLTANVTGTGHLRYPLSATQVIELDLAPKVMNFALDRKTNAWDFQTPAFDSRPLHDLTFRVKTGGE
ncbi:hypothetical protein K8I31_04475, partial [bacterium]|nr:hypothetical protein [bacterium]